MGFMFPVLSAVASAASTVIGAAASMQQAKGQQAMAEFQAKQEEVQAKQARAEGQRHALDKRREGDLVGARLRARAAASGGGATDPTVLALGENIAGRGEYEAATEMYRGENRARGLLDQAAGHRYSGQLAVMDARNRQTASMVSAMSTVLGGMGSSYDKYQKYNNGFDYNWWDG